MILHEQKIRIPNKIRALLRKRRIGAFLLSEQSFKFLIKLWDQTSDTVGMASLEERLIFINVGRMHREKFSQGQINLVVLHEIAHVILSSSNEDLVEAHARNLSCKHDVLIEDV